MHYYNQNAYLYFTLMNFNAKQVFLIIIFI